MMRELEIAQQCTELENTFARYYTADSGSEAKALLQCEIDAFNERVRTVNDEIQIQQSQLQTLLNEVHQVEVQIETTCNRLERSCPNVYDAGAVDIHNRLVEEHNALISEHQLVVERCKKLEQDIDMQVKQANEELSAWKQRLESAQTEANASSQDYESWIAENGPESFFTRLNRFYSILHQKVVNEGEDCDNLEKYINRVRTMRSELGICAMEQQRNTENGLLVYPVIVCKKEECHFIVDIGASIVSITPEMVDVLGLAERIGEEVDLSLPDGIRVRAPKVTIPSISVNGMEATDVEGVVLKEPFAGIDGCLGMSFLNQFQYTINKKESPQLILAA